MWIPPHQSVVVNSACRHGCAGPLPPCALQLLRSPASRDWSQSCFNFWLSCSEVPLSWHRLVPARRGWGAVMGTPRFLRVLELGVGGGIEVEQQAGSSGIQWHSMPPRFSDSLSLNPLSLSWHGRSRNSHASRSCPLRDWPVPSEPILRRDPPLHLNSIMDRTEFHPSSSCPNHTSVPSHYLSSRSEIEGTLKGF